MSIVFTIYQKKKKIRFVFSNRSFTLIEALISIFVMSSIIFLLFNFMSVLKNTIHHDIKKNSYTIAIIHIKEDLLETKECNVKNGELFLKLYNDVKVSYTFEKNRLVRKVNNKGYEIILSDIKMGSFINENNNIYLKIKFLDDEKIKKEVIYDF